MAFPTRRTIVRRKVTPLSDGDDTLVASEFGIDGGLTTKRYNTLAPFYHLQPTIPSPFTPTLDASLEAILRFAQLYAQICPAITMITNRLLAPPSPRIDWVSLMKPFLISENEDHKTLMAELIFLITRTLLPNQIAENRELLLSMYTIKRTAQMKFRLRYDMLREWRKGRHAHVLNIPAMIADPASEDNYVASNAIIATANPRYPFRRPLMQNVIPTLVTARSEDYGRKLVLDKMKHHVTDIDDLLMLKDEDVETWSLMMALVKGPAVLCTWSSLRQANAKLEDMQVNQWDDLDGKQGLEWFVD